MNTEEKLTKKRRQIDLLKEGGSILPSLEAIERTAYFLCMWISSVGLCADNRRLVGEGQILEGVICQTEVFGFYFKGYG